MYMTNIALRKYARCKVVLLLARTIARVDVYRIIISVGSIGGETGRRKLFGAEFGTKSTYVLSTF